MKLISVVVPTYNQSEYLLTCLDALWFQEHPDIEIIVVNDGSTDCTHRMLEAYKGIISEEKVSFASHYNDMKGTVERSWHRRYPPAGRELKIISHDRNLGLSRAINTGLEAAKGQYCTFFASDDVPLPHMLGELARCLDRGYDFAYADMHIVDDAGRILRRFSLPDYSFENAFCHWYLCGVCKLYRRELHEKYGYYDEKIKPQDHEMFLRFAMNGARFVHVPKVLANVRIHDAERQVDNHTPANWNRLYEQSSALVMKARRHSAEST